LTAAAIITRAIFLFGSWALLGLLIRWTTRKGDTEQNSHRLVSIILFFMLSLYVTHVAAAIPHEAGHAGVCIALGGNVGGFEHG
jgi:hypothetical protein